MSRGLRQRPMVMIGKDTYEDLTPEASRRDHRRLCRRQWRQHQARHADRPGVSAPEGGPTSLTTEEPKAGRAPRRPMPKPCRLRSTALRSASEAARPKSTDAETNAALKTPATAPKAAAHAKAAEQQPISGTAGRRTGAEGCRQGRGCSGGKACPDRQEPSGQIEKPAAPDDLKMISGVGPKIEATLNEI
ncbi:hypothetical protein ACOJBO_38120 [Rhizobium beringeri]